MSGIAWLVLVTSTLAAELVWEQDLESDDGGFVSYGETGQWEWGVVASGPGASFDGKRCWATRLAGWYLNDASDHVELPALPVDGLKQPVLGFQHWYSLQDGDQGTVELSSGGSWIRLEPVYGYPFEEGYGASSDGWETAWFDLAGLAPADTVRLTLAADKAGAESGWYVDAFELWDGDAVPPLVLPGDCFEDTEQLDTPYSLEVEVFDNVGLDEVQVLYSVDGGEQQQSSMILTGADTWQGTIPAQESGTTVQYQFRAFDGSNESIAPSEPCSFEVRLPAPTELTAPSGVVWGSTVELDWLAPDSSHEVVGYRVYRDDRLLLEIEEPPADAAVVTGMQSFGVSALYLQGEGNRSESVEVQAAVPDVFGLEPDQAYQGDLIRLTLQGEYLLLEQGEVTLDLGQGIRVDDCDVRDVDVAYVTVQVGSHADPGVRDIVLTTGEQQILLDGAFEVLDGSERPTLLGIEPDALRQGEQATLLVTASQPFDGEPSVWLGDSILVEASEWIQEDQVQIDVVVPYDTPLGLHGLEVDDGTRIYTGLQLQVRDYLEQLGPDGCCSSNPRGTRGWLALLLAPLVVLRRRRQGQR